MAFLFFFNLHFKEYSLREFLIFLIRFYISLFNITFNYSSKLKLLYFFQIEDYSTSSAPPVAVPLAPGLGPLPEAPAPG